MCRQKLAGALHLAVIAAAGFVIDVVPVMDSATGFAIKAFFEKPAKRPRKHALEDLFSSDTAVSIQNASRKSCCFPDWLHSYHPTITKTGKTTLASLARDSLSRTRRGASNVKAA
jgi:hypothetical protein